MAVYRSYTVREPITCKRQCEFCKHRYEHVRYFECHSHGTGAGYIPTEETFDKLKKKFCKSPRNQATYGVLCPKCLRFSTAALNQHLPGSPSNGFLHLANHIFLRVAAVQVGVLLFVLAVAVGFQMAQVQWRWEAAAALIVMLATWLCIRVYKLYAVRGLIKTFTDAQIQQILAAEYLRSGIDSMYGLFHSQSGVPEFAQFGRKTAALIFYGSQPVNVVWGRRLGVMKQRLEEQRSYLDQSMQSKQHGEVTARKRATASKINRRDGTA